MVAEKLIRNERPGNKEYNLAMNSLPGIMALTAILRFKDGKLAQQWLDGPFKQKNSDLLESMLLHKEDFPSWDDFRRWLRKFLATVIAYIDEGEKG